MILYCSSKISTQSQQIVNKKKILAADRNPLPIPGVIERREAGGIGTGRTSVRRDLCSSGRKSTHGQLVNQSTLTASTARPSGTGLSSAVDAVRLSVAAGALSPSATASASRTRKAFLSCPRAARPAMIGRTGRSDALYGATDRKTGIPRCGIPERIENCLCPFSGKGHRNGRTRLLRKSRPVMQEKRHFRDTDGKLLSRGKPPPGAPKYDRIELDPALSTFICLPSAT